MTDTSHNYAPWMSKSDGCDISDRCLECPAPMCRYDDNRAFNKWRRARAGERSLTVEQMVGMNVPQIVEYMGVAVRTAHRWRRKALDAVLELGVTGTHAGCGGR